MTNDSWQCALWLQIISDCPGPQTTLTCAAETRGEVSENEQLQLLAEETSLLTRWQCALITGQIIFQAGKSVGDESVHGCASPCYILSFLRTVF